MPTTYLLLRHNKQTGPYSLDRLLQQDLQPQDLIWEEGRSTGWRNPAEIEALKPHINAQNRVQEAFGTHHITLQQPVANAGFRTLPNSPTHIYVALPAGRQHAEETEPPAVLSLEAKAEALYERVQAFSSGRPVDDPDVPYTRSLQDMKQEYSAWRTQQQKKKKYSSARRKIFIAASVVVITTTSFGITKWISTKTAVVHEPAATFTPEALRLASGSEHMPVFLNELADSSIIRNELPVVQIKPDEKGPSVKSTSRPATTKDKKAVSKLLTVTSVATDTSSAPAPPAPEVKATVKSEVRKVVPLSRLVLVNGAVQYDKKGTTITAADITLHNNSSETLKAVKVMVTYYKKEDRPLNTETVVFYNVQPSSAPVINVVPARRATSARFQIGTITRADGSLYLIH